MGGGGRTIKKNLDQFLAYGLDQFLLVNAQILDQLLTLWRELIWTTFFAAISRNLRKRSAKCNKTKKKKLKNGPAKSAREWGSDTHPQNEVAFSAFSGLALPGAPVGSEKNTVLGTRFSRGKTWFSLFQVVPLLHVFLGCVYVSDGEAPEAGAQAAEQRRRRRRRRKKKQKNNKNGKITRRRRRRRRREEVKGKLRRWRLFFDSCSKGF